MDYTLLIHSIDENYTAATPEQVDAMYQGHYAFMQALKEAGVAVPYSAELEPATTGRIVRPGGDDDRVITDGPFSETKEQVGGFYVIDVPDLDTAVSWARHIPLLPGESVEVRPAKK